MEYLIKCTNVHTGIETFVTDIHGEPAVWPNADAAEFQIRAFEATAGYKPPVNVRWEAVPYRR